MNGSHVELFSYAYYHDELKRLSAKGQLNPIAVSDYFEVSNTEDEPYFELSYDCGNERSDFWVDYVNEHYRIWFLPDFLVDFPQIDSLLTSIGPLEIDGDFRRVAVRSNRISKVLRELASKLDR